MFTARYGLSRYITQARLFFKGLKQQNRVYVNSVFTSRLYVGQSTVTGVGSMEFCRKELSKNKYQPHVMYVYHF